MLEFTSTYADPAQVVNLFEMLQLLSELDNLKSETSWIIFKTHLIVKSIDVSNNFYYSCTQSPLTGSFRQYYIYF